MVELLDEQGGFRKRHSFTLATIIQMETLRFCRRFLTQDAREARAKFYDPQGRQYDQMTQAARSARQGIIEGAERRNDGQTQDLASLRGGVRASLSGLRSDYEMVILDRGMLPWSMHAAEAKAVNAVSLDAAACEDDLVHEAAKQALQLRKKYARWLDADDAAVVANVMLLIIGRTLDLLQSQVDTKGQAREDAATFRERPAAKRSATREKDKAAAPECPKCGKVMRRRQSAKGEFWGCSAYPECKGTRRIGREGETA